MVLPFIAATMRDVFDTVPAMLKESGYGLGATTWEVIWKVVVPHSRVGIVGGIMLGLGRALGETMAVTFVIGNAHRISSSLLAPGTTISSAIANEFTRGGRRPVYLLVDCAGAAAVPHHVHGDRGGAGDAAQAGTAGSFRHMSRRSLRKFKNGVFLLLSLVATMTGLVLPGGHPLDSAVPRPRGYVVASVHPDHSSARRAGGVAECPVRQCGDDSARHPHRFAHRRARPAPTWPSTAAIPG